MTVRITIIGLGQIGASLGLALAAHKDQVSTLGHDKSPTTARQAQKLGAVEAVAYTLHGAVQKADVVVLAIPLNEMRSVLEVIAPVLKEDAVVLDTSPVKTAVAGWVKELLPPGRHYVGLAPALNPEVLYDPGGGLEAARADLFTRGVIAICAPQGTANGALKLAADLVSLAGAQPFFADLVEVDGLMGAAHLLPELAAAALAETLTGQPGWSDIRKMTGKPFTSGTAGVEGDEAAALAEALLLNRDNSLRLLDEVIDRLGEWRVLVAGEKRGEMKKRLKAVRERHARWLQERMKGDWQAVEGRRAELPTMRGVLKQQIGGLDKLFRRGDKPGGEE